ncbi:MAG: hypothetical protein EXS38_11450 [Opitutus sp.]|nr:hypothetical protein [Opitutus sp.]
MLGDGAFEVEAAFAGVHASGNLKAVARNLGPWVRPLERAGPITVAIAFDAAHREKSLRVERLTATVEGSQPIAALQSLQPFAVDEKTGALAMSDPRGDWIECALKGLPIGLLAGWSAHLSGTGNAARSDFILRSAEGRVSVQSKTPLTATNISLGNDGQPLAEKIDLSAMLQAASTDRGWEIHCVPLIISSAGRQSARLEGSATTPSGSDQGITLAGTWETDLAALTLQPGLSEISWLKGRSAAGDFSTHFGTWFDLKGKLTAMGLEPNHAVTASVNVDIDGAGRLSFVAPLKIFFGSNVSDFSLEGKRTGQGAGAELYVDLTGENVTLDHLGLLAAPFAASQNLGPGPDRVPFWSEATGRVTLAFRKFHAWDQDYQDVGGTFSLDRGSLRLEGGHATLPPHSATKLAGEILLNPAVRGLMP